MSIDVDPDHGELRFRWLPDRGGEPPAVTLTPKGMPAATVQPQKDADGVWRGTIDLKASTLYYKLEKYGLSEGSERED